jgi:Methylamine utilisation protein MauE
VLEVIAGLILGGVLVGAALAKLASPSSSRAALASFGITQAGSQGVAWAALVAAELALGAGVIAGLDLAALLAAALMLLFAGTVAGAIMRGRAGAPCACFGARSTVGWRQVARNLILAACFAAIPLLPGREPTTEEWLGIGLGVALLGCAALAVAVAALAREIGILRLRLGPEGALELDHEGPSLGSQAAAVARFAPGPAAEYALAVFTSEGCRVCSALEPALASLAGDPLVALETFDESRDAAIWEQLDVPGSPYAVAMSLDGTVLAKGAFNTLAQLESVLAAAERRRADRGLVEALGGG